jgi:hypothetical protein
MLSAKSFAEILVGIGIAVVATAAPAAGSVTFDGERAERVYGAYVAYLERDPATFAPELATIRQLQQSDVEYRVRIGGAFGDSVYGELTTDGERVIVRISDGEGANGRGVEIFSRFSERACFAHELEHARQFDSGEFSFERDPATGRWYAERPSFDIGDEMRAWKVQLRLSNHSDFWRRPEGRAQARPSLLAEFAAAKTDADRMRVLQRNGYGAIYAVPNCVVSAPTSQIRPGQLVRPDRVSNFFGRVPPSR